MTQHMVRCESFSPTRMEFPENDTIVFENYQKMVEIPAYIVAC